MALKLWLSADLSKIDFTANNSLISKVYDLTSNHYDCTNVGNIYLEPCEGIKAFSFKMQATNYLECASFPALGSASWTMAVTAASLDANPLGSTVGFFSVGGNEAAGRFLGLYKSGGTHAPDFGSLTEGTNLISEYDCAYKWNAFICTYDSITQNLVGYCNNLNRFVSKTVALNITSKYQFNSLGTGANSYGSSKGYINEAMIFDTALNDTQINNLFLYFAKRLSPSTFGDNKTRVRDYVFNRVAV